MKPIYQKFIALSKKEKELNAIIREHRSIIREHEQTILREGCPNVLIDGAVKCIELHIEKLCDCELELGHTIEEKLSLINNKELTPEEALFLDIINV